MYITGKIIAIDQTMPRVKIEVKEYDNFISGWFFVPQLCTVKDKSYNTMELHTLVAAVCTNDMQDGCVIGALYNDEDICILSDKNKKYIFFEDGTKILYDKKEKNLLIDAVNSINLKAVQTNFTTDLKIKGNLDVDGDITSTGNISDKAYAMEEMRNKYNSHNHTNGNNGDDTSVPQQQF